MALEICAKGWRQVIVEKYRVLSGRWCSKEAQGPYGVCFFQRILGMAGNFLQLCIFQG
jgi:hypothetical protein